eukprot:3875845-Amphidinium_carterae.4
MEHATDVSCDTFAGTPIDRFGWQSFGRQRDAMGVPTALQPLLAIYDVSTAFFHAVLPESERIYVKPPLGEDNEGVLWKLQRAMYGTRLASFMFQEYTQEVMARFVFTRLRVTVQVYWLIHGDDFLVSAEARVQDEIHTFLAEHFSIQAGPCIGPDRLGGVAEGYYFKRRIVEQDGFHLGGRPKARFNRHSNPRGDSPQARNVTQYDAGKSDPYAEKPLDTEPL